MLLLGINVLWLMPPPPGKFPSLHACWRQNCVRFCRKRCFTGIQRDGSWELELHYVKIRSEKKTEQKKGRNVLLPPHSSQESATCQAASCPAHLTFLLWYRVQWCQVAAAAAFSSHSGWSACAAVINILSSPLKGVALNAPEEHWGNFPYRVGLNFCQSDSSNLELYFKTRSLWVHVMPERMWGYGQRVEHVTEIRGVEKKNLSVIHSNRSPLSAWRV